MFARLKSCLFVLKSRTVRWMGGYLPVVGYGLEKLRAELPAIQEYVPAGLYKGVMVAGVVALVLRVVTDKPLSSYQGDAK